MPTTKEWILSALGIDKYVPPPTFRVGVVSMRCALWWRVVTRHAFARQLFPRSISISLTRLSDAWSPWAAERERSMVRTWERRRQGGGATPRAPGWCVDPVIIRISLTFSAGGLLSFFGWFCPCSHLDAKKCIRVSFSLPFGRKLSRRTQCLGWARSKSRSTTTSRRSAREACSGARCHQARYIHLCLPVILAF